MGLFDGLLGGKKAAKAAAPKPEKPNQEFFLDPDEAKTFGNIDYMRTAKAVRKTFPATGGAKEGAEVIEVVSSLEKVDIEAKNRAAIEPTLEDVNQPAPEVSERRQRDNNLDIFRNMAKDLRKS
ncbi:hypothetical protein [Synechococcus sp. PCC 6312]|uniref:hypothetical protein n=1 Tax=Synechococcus sp. (strain ATCC 27167 / PCC 6312) TaxID=195253 RepID=UPI00029F1993|nr:hypothetical protein [Synechococcus sp. PCC 6312]AFY59980.1 hypothetical protein Syn6312_0764 [Synechococcus sp. PCC 6312]